VDTRTLIKKSLGNVGFGRPRTNWKPAQRWRWLSPGMLSPCSRVEFYRHFRCACRLHHQSDVSSHRSTKPTAVSNSYSRIPSLQLMHCLSQTYPCFVPKSRYQSMYCLILNFLVTMRIAECVTNSSKRFRC
jgi:hypothetical protein